MSHLIQDIRKLESVSTIFSGMCIIILMVCTSFTALYLLSRLAPAWNLDYLPWLAGLAAFESLLGQRRLQKTSELTINPGVYRLVELLFIVIITRIASLPWGTDIDFGLLLLSWQTNFLEKFFDVQFLLSLVVVILIWGITAGFAQDLMDQEGDELALDAANLEGLVSDRAAAQQRLAGRVIAVGGILVFINGLLRQDIIRLFGDSAAPKQDAWHVIVYFVVGLVLLSLSQLANRRLAWAWERIPVKADIVGRWMLYSVLFLVVVVLVAFALPTGYTLGFLPTLSSALGLILSLLYGVIMLILTPIFYIFAWLLSLFGVATTDSPLETLQPTQLLPQEIMTPSTPPAWLELLKSILFWVVLIGVVGYAVYIHINQNKKLVTRLSKVRGFHWLTQAWAWLLQHFKTGVGRGSGLVARTLHRWRASFRTRPRSEPGGYLSLRRLNPRQKVIFYYLALLRRTDEAKLPRAGWQTPAEYESYLGQLLPDVKPEISSMTEIFMEARYSQHIVGESHTLSIRLAWEQVRKFLRRHLQLQKK